MQDKILYHVHITRGKTLRHQKGNKRNGRIDNKMDKKRNDKKTNSDRQGYTKSKDWET